MTAETPHPLDGQFEPQAEAWAKMQPTIPASEIAQVSTAISLRRLADAFTSSVNDYGETLPEAIAGELRRGLRS